MILQLALVALVALAAARAEACGEYWVSPDGNDASPGTSAAPFRSLDRARDAVRADPLRGQCEIHVNLRGE